MKFSPAKTKNPVTIEMVLNPQDFATTVSNSSWKQSIAKYFFEALEKRLGTKLLLQTPSYLKDAPVSLTKNYSKLTKLRLAGLIKEVGVLKQYPDEPPIHLMYALGPRLGSGANFFDSDSALWSALGECVERSLWTSSSEWFLGKTRSSTHKNLSGKKMEITGIAGFSIDQRNQNACLVLSENDELSWVKVIEAVSGQMAWAPLQLFSGKHASENCKKPNQPDGKEPLLRWEVTTGLASSSFGLEDASLRGALEVIERDAFMITWLNRISPPRVDVGMLRAQNEEIGEVLDSLKRYHLHLELLKLPTDFSTPVIAAILVDNSGKGPALSIGAKAHENLTQAILGAIAEAVSVRHYLKEIYNEPIKGNQMGRKERLVYWADYINLTKADFLFKGPIIDPKEIMLPRNTEITFKSICKEMGAKGYTLYVANISSTEARDCGIYSVCVVSPDLQPMHLDEQLPYIGGQRIKNVPLILNYKTTKELNFEPHPFP